MTLGFRTKHRNKPTEFPAKILAGTKIHSFREDPHNRWQEGQLIQMATGVRTDKYNQFHEAICTGTQTIYIEFHTAFNALPVMVYVDDRELSDPEILQLATNDGFDTIDDFIYWFRTDFEGKIIHWTDFRY